MNPVAYNIKPDKPIFFLLVGQIVYYRDGKQPERIWVLNTYLSASSRRKEERKMKRQSADIIFIFIEWEVTMEDIFEHGNLVTVFQSDKVPLSDKMDIFRQITHSP